MEITRSTGRKVAIIHLSGIFEYHDESKLLTAMRHSVEEAPDLVAIDLAGVDNLNSACMAALLSMLKIADEARLHFILYGMNARVHMLIEKVFSRDYVPLLSTEEFAERYL
ncbi:MAG TPA: STAS domain-containing protein [Spirochaetota bacterium]|nr:STAS domain-containing protein [Spirochaetota bacterium]